MMWPDYSGALCLCHLPVLVPSFWEIPDTTQLPASLPEVAFEVGPWLGAVPPCQLRPGCPSVLVPKPVLQLLLSDTCCVGVGGGSGVCTKQGSRGLAPQNQEKRSISTPPSADIPTWKTQSRSRTSSKATSVQGVGRNQASACRAGLSDSLLQIVESGCLQCPSLGAVLDLLSVT